MKKLSLLLLAATIGMSTMAHEDHGKKGKKSKHEKKYNKRSNNDGGRDGRYEDNRGSNNDWNSSRNVPRKVRDVFNRDFPAARNANWSQNKGVWTASFGRNGLFGGNQTVSYHANGRRVNDNRWGGNNNRNDRNNYDRDND